MKEVPALGNAQCARSAHTQPDTLGAEPIRIVLADDHEFSREAIAVRLWNATDMEIVGQAQDGQQLIGLVETLAPDVVLSDISMPNMDGISATELIRRRHPQVRIVLITMHDAPEYVKRALAAGAHGYLLKDAEGEEIQNAIRLVMMDGVPYVDPAVSHALGPSPQAASLV